MTARHFPRKQPASRALARPAGGVLAAVVSCTIGTTKSLRESPAVSMQASDPALGTREVRFLRMTCSRKGHAAAPLGTIESP
jgi:hypothetical protein